MPISQVNGDRSTTRDRCLEGRVCRERDRRGGFTLIEMVLALAIFGLIAALALPFSRHRSGAAALRVKTFEVVALLRADRNAAWQSGVSATLVIDPDRRQLRSSQSQAQVTMPASIQMQLAQGAPQISFYPDGRSSGGQLLLSSGTTTFTVDVNRMTSAVEASVR